MLAPEAMATSVRPFARLRSIQRLAPASASAPAGSSTVRVSSKTSLIAAQISSVSTSTISSTSSLARRNVSRPTCRTATPSAKRFTCASVTRLPAFSEWNIAAESTGSTPITRVRGETRFT